MTSAPTATGQTSTTANTTETSETTSTSSSTTTTGGPFFLSFSTNVGQITEGESVVFTATLSDPDGLNDIVGGTLFTGDGGFSYGPFIAAGQEGVYSIEVTWDAVDQVAEIEFEELSMERVFRAEFFDTKGNSVVRDTEVSLYCEGGGACGGMCKDFQVDSENCGACGSACQSGCADATCLPVLGECIGINSGFSSCADYCQGEGVQCVEAGCDESTYIGYNSTPFCVKNQGAFGSFNTPCEHVNSWGPGEIAVRCCCTDST